jgi:hypothetical protein
MAIEFMPSQDNRFGLGCMTLIFLLLGSFYIITSLLALKHGTTVLYGRYTKIHVSPWFTLILGCIFLGAGIAGAWKIYKDKDKYPF